MPDRLRELDDYIESLRGGRDARRAGMKAPAAAPRKGGGKNDSGGGGGPAATPAAQALSRGWMGPWAMSAAARPPRRNGGRAGKPVRAARRSFGVGLGGIDYRVPGIVPVLRQISPRTCWATVTAMMVSWKDAASVTPRDAAGRGGQRFLTLFDADNVLPNTERAAFFGAVGLTEEPPMSWTIAGWEQMLRSCGPLYVSTGQVDNPETHARVIVGIRGDGTPDGTTFDVIDPATGTEGTERFSDFLAGYEAIPRSAGPTRTQVAHWPTGSRPASEAQSMARGGGRSSGLGSAWEHARGRSSAFGSGQQHVQNNLTLSDAGVVFISDSEGFMAAKYNDPVGHCTIGFGHLLHHGNCNGTEPAEFNNPISRDRALELLRADAADAARTINNAVVVALSQTQFDALVSFTFNVGNQAFLDSTLLRELNAGNYAEVPNQLNRWVKGGNPLKTLPGLVTRRAKEGALFRDGTY